MWQSCLAPSQMKNVSKHHLSPLSQIFLCVCVCARRVCVCGSLSFSFLYHRFLFLVFTFFFLFSSVQREHDVKESILFMAKQSGNLDPNVRARSDIIIICNTELVSPCYFSFMVYMSKKKRGGGEDYVAACKGLSALCKNESASEVHNLNNLNWCALFAST